MTDVIDQVISTLKQNSDEKTRHSGQNFFKEKVRLHGVKAASVRAISKEFFNEIKGRSKSEIFGLCESLWQAGHLEESFIACDWSHRIHKQYLPEDMKTFETWIDSYLSNWASCDTLCNYTIGTLLEMYPEQISEIEKWTASSNRWKRRASAVSLIVPARKGLFLANILSIADSLLVDRDDLVQKGYGWMLKAASQAHLNEVFDFVMARRETMPRTAFRYAIEKMPRTMKAEAMKKTGEQP